MALFALMGSPASAAGTQTEGNPPTAESFGITYYATDEEGERTRQLTANDLRFFLNRARCECNHQVSTKILMAREGAVSNQPIVTFIGTSCDDGQATTNRQNPPCALAYTGFPADYRTEVNFNFDPLWLGAGVAGNSQDIDEATPTLSCEASIAQTGGVWMCGENGTKTDCQPDEFFITGSQNLNTNESLGLRVDFTPPDVSQITNVSTSAGEGSVRLTWEQTTTTDIYAFRVLCADANDEALEGRGYMPRSLYDEAIGGIYVTWHNLCPDGPFSPRPDADLIETPLGTTGTTGTSATGGEQTTGSDTGDSGDTATGIGFDALFATDEGSAGSGLEAGAESSGTGAESGTSEAGSEAGGVDSGDDSDTPPRPTTGIASLNWEYVCSDSLGATSQSARIDGLENGRRYRFLLVAYDQSGNPREVGEILEDTPRSTIDLWEQCELQGNVCGDGGFCSVAPGRPRPLTALLWAFALSLGYAARRRGHARAARSASRRAS